MKVETQAIDYARDVHDLGVIFCSEGDWTADRTMKSLGDLEGLFQDFAESGEFRGAKDEMVLVHTRGAIPTKRLLLVGLGPRDGIDLERLRRAAAVAARKVRSTRVGSFAVLVPDPPAGATPTATVQALVEGALIALHQFREYKTEGNDKITPITDLRIGTDPSRMGAEIGEGARAGEVAAQAVGWARSLALHPGNVMTPSRLAREAEALAEHPDITVEVKDEAWMEEMKMGGILAVTRGSEEPARFIILDYQPSGSTGAPVVLIGKGVTFDTGGYSLKPRVGMGDMKTDMAGAAAVLGTFRIGAELGFPVRVVGLIPTAENRAGSRAYLPGDVLTMMSGKTVEVISTDAEGRLMLADSLTFAARYSPAAVVDVATLTGAVLIALGHLASGVMGRDAALIDRIRRAGEVTGERVWEFPLWPDFRSQIRSDVADIKNSGGRPANAITAGMFLAEFAEGYPWAHLDIAGTALIDRDLSCFSKGVTGTGPRLLAEFLRSWEV